MTDVRFRDSGPRNEPPAVAAVSASGPVERPSAASEATTHPVVDVLRDVATQTKTRPRPGRLGWTARTIATGLIDPGAIEAHDAEHRFVAALRAPQMSGRVVGVVAGKGGVGGTTVAIGLARTFAALRDDAVALVDGHAAAGLSLSQRVLGRRGHTIREFGRSPRSLGRRGLHVFDAASWTDPADGPEIEVATRRQVATHSFTIIDAGNDASPAAQAALALADEMIVVTSAEPAALASVAPTIERVAARPGGRGTGVTVVVVLTRPTPTVRARRRLRSHLDTPSVVIPYDPALADGVGADLDALRRATRAAYLRLAAAVVNMQDRTEAE